MKVHNMAREKKQYVPTVELGDGTVGGATTKEVTPQKKAKVDDIINDLFSYLEKKYGVDVSKNTEFARLYLSHFLKSNAASSR